MPPNIVDVPIPTAVENEEENKATPSNSTNIVIDDSNIAPRAVPPPAPQGTDKLKTFMTTLNTVAHITIGVVVSLSMLFAFRSGTPLGATPLHIVLCVTGYQLLMAQAILSLSEHNSWSAHLRLGDKRRAHLILQIVGSGLAIAGSFIKILDKTSHWTSLHGQFALVALVFTSVSLVNGFASWWAHDLRRVLPANLSKLTHICFGTVAFAAACISLCYGLEKGSFKSWMGDYVANTAITCTALLCFIVIVTPSVTFLQKSSRLVRR